MAPSLKQQRAKINGVAIPAKVPEGQEPSKSQRSHLNDTTSDKDRIKTCPICGHTAKKLGKIRSHFAACVKMNGTPTGGRWDDDLTFMPRPHLAKRKHDDLDDVADTDAPSTSKRAARGQTTQEQREERQRQFHERLTAVNGVVVPSKLAPGQTPVKKIFETGADRKYQCPICGSMHKKRYHVQSHFAVCVETNGNPTGARWDEAWKGATSRTDRASAQVSQELQDHQLEDDQPEEHELADLHFDDSEMNDVPPNGHQHSKIQSASPPSHDFQTRRAGFEHLDPQPMSSSNSLDPHHPDLKHIDPLTSSSNSPDSYHPALEYLDTKALSSSSDELTSYDSTLRMEALANAAIFSMAQE